ncbi:MAG TPA: asparagine synthase (glutamine-hydrolyzing) [Candidatus Binatia bacterium]|nr:asparagine synthase (glutamine-hydrolyzing) [Candidatus Binatia bacterium]
MCGIAGIVHFEREHAVSPATVAAMADLLHHRGPNDHGLWVRGSVGLGHRRLSILDLSPRGRQPVANEDGSVRVVFNGEIYNFKELHDELSARGHRFSSDTDTEVLVHLWEDMREGLVARLRGMFAFAIWDDNDRTLFLARDRLGKKPLYYCIDAQGVAFASEPKALLVVPGVRREPNPLAIHEYLKLGYVPSPQSAFSGVRRLAPAHWSLFRDGRQHTQRYWNIRYEPKVRASEGELLEELEEKLAEAVRLRMRADVPLGALLSGGVDSSAVVALMRRVTTGPLKTFSIGFEDEKWNELPFARRVARHFSTDHEDLIIRPEATSVLPKLSWHYDEPFADSSALPSFWLCEMARRTVTVALGGDGGDECFAGYDRYLAGVLARPFDAVPAPARSAFARAFGRVVPSGSPKSLAHRAQRFFAAAGLGPRERYASWTTVFDGEGRAGLYTSDFAATIATQKPGCTFERAWELADAPSFVERILQVDVVTYLPDDLLVKMDIASMAHGLEVRSPLLDQQVVEFAARMPVKMKLRGLTQKWALKELMKDRLPAGIVFRKKSGFGVPIDRWFRNDLQAFARDALLSTRALSRGYFRRTSIEALLDEHASGGAHHHHRLWALLMLELWHQSFIDAPSVGSAAVTSSVAGERRVSGA